MHNHAPENYVCPFCSLIRGIVNEPTYSTQDDIVYRGASVTAFIGSHQWDGNHPNVIIAPNEHFENIFDLPDHYGNEIHAAARRIALALKVLYACDGISTRQHNEPAGNQDVWHYHMHVTPRFANDSLYQKIFERKLMPISERAGHAQKLRDYFSNHSII
jgi:histidine triad (HIT) family protein